VGWVGSEVGQYLDVGEDCSLGVEDLGIAVSNGQSHRLISLTFMVLLDF
jgi:hypothetical protein